MCIRDSPYTSWILDLPIRSNDGRLSFAPALLQKNTESSAAALPLTRANVIGQAFKFLGERYGWGHSYNGRDCSGFVSDVYRSMGVQMPRNTSAQAVSPVFSRSHFDTHTTRQQRMAAVAALDVGDPVSYTHLDVYKRQPRHWLWSSWICRGSPRHM